MSGESDPGRKRSAKEQRMSGIHAVQWHERVITSFPRYGEDVECLFWGQITKERILSAVLREFRPYALSELPQDAFVPLPNRDQDSKKIQTYFVGEVDLVSSDAPKINKDQQERFISTRNALARCYKQSMARPLLDRLSIIDPKILWAMEASYFHKMSSVEVGKKIGQSQSQAYDNIQVGLRLLGIIDESRKPIEKRFDRWLLPAVIRFPEIATIISGLPAHLQIPAWEIVRGREVHGKAGVAQKYGVSTNDLENLRDELFFGRLSFSRTPFAAEREKVAVFHLGDIPYRQQPFTLLALQFLEAKIAGKGAGETGIGKDEEHIVAVHLIDNLVNAFPDLEAKITPTIQRGVKRRTDNQRRHFSFSPSFWQSIQERYLQFIDIMESEGRSITDYDRVFIDRFCSGETITKDDKARAHVLLGAPKPHVGSSENRALLAEAFVEEAGLVTLSDNQTKEIVGLIQSGTPFLQIMQRYQHLGPSQLLTLQKQMVGYVIKARHQAWTTRLKEKYVPVGISDLKTKQGNQGGVNPVVEIEADEVVDNNPPSNEEITQENREDDDIKRNDVPKHEDLIVPAEINPKCILNEGHVMVLGGILFMPQNWRRLKQVLARYGRDVNDVVGHEMQKMHEYIVKKEEG